MVTTTMMKESLQGDDDDKVEVSDSSLHRTQCRPKIEKAITEIECCYLKVELFMFRLTVNLVGNKG
jgi:hypothetical protein